MGIFPSMDVSFSLYDDHLAYCAICSGYGRIDVSEYHMPFIGESKWIQTEKEKACGGCTGSGISERAKQYRLSNR